MIWELACRARYEKSILVLLILFLALFDDCGCAIIVAYPHDGVKYVFVFESSVFVFDFLKGQHLYLNPVFDVFGQI